MSQLCYTVPHISHITGFSENRIKRAITGQWPTTPTARKACGKPLPLLKAKQGSSGSYIILHDDLEDWLHKLPDA